MIGRVGIVSRLDDPQALRTATSLFEFVQNKGLIVIPEDDFARLQHLGGGKPLSEVKADLMVTVGGNGTVLKTSMLMPCPETPILAVNMGRRGYLTEVSPEQAKNAINDCLRGKMRLDERTRLTAIHSSGTSVDGLNEALVAPALPHKIIDVEIKVGSSDLVECRADGLIIATPTGSTAHAFSAGGPVLDPSLDAFVLVFICPVDPLHPIVVPANKDLFVKLKDGASRAAVIVDGRHRQDLLPGASITIRKSKNRAMFVRFDRSRVKRAMVRFSTAETVRSESTSP